MPCIMASGSRTMAPVKVTDNGTHLERLATIEELESLQGYPPGITAGFLEPSATAAKDRTTIIGNSWNYHQISAILREMRPDDHKDWTSVHNAAQTQELDITESERKWLAMDDDDQIAEMKRLMDGYEMTTHYIKTKKSKRKKK